MISLTKYDDVRRIQGQVVQGGKDASQADLSAMIDVLPTLTFNQKTIWPPPPKMPPFLDPATILTAAMDPGLGVRGLHKRGITGKGVRVAIIDQPMYLDHPEFAGKIADSTLIGCPPQSSMHGPAVTSLLAGASLGTAPGATVIYAGVPSWEQDAALYAQALEWIVQKHVQGKAAKNPVRVVSVSASPSGPGSQFTNQAQWDQAVAAARSAGVLVLDCTDHHGVIGPCWFSGVDWQDPACCTPGFPGEPPPAPSGTQILAPTSPRTTAEEYDLGDFGYQYTGKGGLSWAIPYVAGVLALGWQAHPLLKAKPILDLLFQSAYSPDGVTKIISPKAFLKSRPPKP